MWSQTCDFVSLLSGCKNTYLKVENDKNQAINSAQVG